MKKKSEPSVTAPLPASIDSKPRADAKLLNLPEDQQTQLAQWLLDGLSYADARTRIREQFGVEVASLASFTDFWHSVCAPRLLARRENLVRSASTHADAAKYHQQEFDAATFDAVRQQLYARTLDPQTTLQDLEPIVSLLVKVRATEIAFKRAQIASTRLNLQEERAGHLDFARSLSDLLGSGLLKSQEEPRPTDGDA